MDGNKNTKVDNLSQWRDQSSESKEATQSLSEGHKNRFGVAVSDVWTGRRECTLLVAMETYDRDVLCLTAGLVNPTEFGIPEMKVGVFPSTLLNLKLHACILISLHK